MTAEGGAGWSRVTPGCSNLEVRGRCATRRACCRGGGAPRPGPRPGAAAPRPRGSRLGERATPRQHPLRQRAFVLAAEFTDPALTSSLSDVRVESVTVAESVTDVDGTLHTGEPQSVNSRRRVQLTPELVEALTVHRAASYPDAVPRADALVFPRREGWAAAVQELLPAALPSGGGCGAACREAGAAVP